MEGRSGAAAVEDEAKNGLTKHTLTRIISGNNFCLQQVRKSCVQDLVNIYLMRHAGIGRGKIDISPFLIKYDRKPKCKDPFVQNKKFVLETVKVKENSHTTENISSDVCASHLYDQTNNLTEFDFCTDCDEKISKITKLPCVLKVEQPCCPFSERFLWCGCIKSHIAVVHFCDCGSSLPEIFKNEYVPLCAMEDIIKCGDKTGCVNVQDSKSEASSEDKSALVSCKENITSVHDKVHAKRAEEKPSRNRIEVGSCPPSFPPRIGVHFDVNGNRVPEPIKSERKVTAIDHCDLPNSASVPPDTRQRNPQCSCNGPSPTLLASKNILNVEVLNCELKAAVKCSCEQKGTVSTQHSKKCKAYSKSAKAKNIHCAEGSVSSFENLVSTNKYSKGAGTVYGSKNTHLDNCNTSRNPPAEVICDNYSESDILASDTVNKMMFFPALPSSHCVQQGKADSSRFKSSNEVSSENSSSNSDLENLSSVQTSRKPNMQHNASYPSSAPQASYADVIRTPAAAISKMLPPQGVSSVYPENAKVSESSVQPQLENSCSDKLQKKEESNLMGSSDWIISRLSQLDANTNALLKINGVSPHSTPNGLEFVNPQPIAVSLEKPSFYHSGLQTNKNNTYSMSVSPVNLCSPNKVINENRGLTDSNMEKMPVKVNERASVHSPSSHSAVGLGEITSQKQDGPANGRTDSLSSNPSSMNSSICDAFKYASSTSNGDSVDSKSKQTPVVMMDNFMPLENASGISFGIDYEEVVKLCSESDVLSNSVPFCEQPPHQDIEKTSLCNDMCSNAVESAEKPCVCKTEGETSFTCDAVHCKKRAIVDCSKSTSRVTVGGKDLYWDDVEVTYQACDMSALIGYLSESWSTISKEVKGSSNPDAKTKYFEPEHL